MDEKKSEKNFWHLTGRLAQRLEAAVDVERRVVALGVAAVHRARVDVAGRRRRRRLGASRRRRPQRRRRGRRGRRGPAGAGRVVAAVGQRRVKVQRSVGAAAVQRRRSHSSSTNKKMPRKCDFFFHSFQKCLSRTIALLLCRGRSSSNFKKKNDLMGSIVM